MSSITLKQIAISKRNYEALKKLGGAGDSFNDVISKLLKIATVITEKEIEKEGRVQGKAASGFSRLAATQSTDSSSSSNTTTSEVTM